MAYVVVVDDDTAILDSISQILKDAGHQVKTTTDALHALELIGREQPDLVILDILMPDINGIDICRRLRADPFLSRLPIIFLTAKSRPRDIVFGLDAGGDDYLVKPFNAIELPARVNALLRRTPGSTLDSQAQALTVDQLRLHLTSLDLDIGERRVRLTPIEHHVMYYLMQHVRQPVTTEQLLEEVWGYAPGQGDPQLVRVHITNLRNKLAFTPEDPYYIHNLHGRGYLIRNG